MDQDLSESARSALHELTHRVDQLETVAGQLETAVYALQAAASAKPSEPQQPALAAPAVRPGGVCREEVFAVLFGCRDLTLMEQADALMKHRVIGPLLRGEHLAGAAPASVGVNVQELVDCLPKGSYHRPTLAACLLGHPRLGPLLRGEGAPAPRRVVLPEMPPLPKHPTNGPMGGIFLNGYCDGWAAACAEVERQQGQQDGGQVDG